MNIKSKKLIHGLSTALLFGSSTTYAATVTVTPTNNEGWNEIFQAGAATVAITTTEPYPAGKTASLEYTATDSGDDIVGIGKLFLAEKLTDLSVIAFDYYSDAENPPPSMRVEYTSLLPFTFGTLVWAPPVGTGWSSATADPAVDLWRDSASGDSKTLNQWQADLGDVNVRFIYVAVGRSANAGRTVFADLVEIQFQGEPESTVYDFEEEGSLPVPPTKINAVGVIESQVGGFKFPDGTIQSTAARIGSAPQPTFPATYVVTAHDAVGGVNTFVACDVGDQIVSGGGRCHGAGGPLDPMHKSCPANAAGACLDSGDASGTGFVTWAVQCDLNAQAVSYAVCLDMTP